MRALKLLGKVVAGLAVAGVLLAGGALTLLRTRWGGDRLRDLLVGRVDGAIAGRLSIGALRFAGDTFVLRDVVVRAPSGVVVARIERVALRFDLWALLRRQAHVRALDLLRPAVVLAPSARGGGLSLSRALSAREGSRGRGSTAGEAGGSRWGVAVDRLSVTEGRISMMTAPLERSPEPAATITHLRAAGSLAARPRAGTFAVGLSLTGDGGGALHGRVALEASAHRRAGEREAVLTLALDDVARVRGGARGAAWWLSVDELTIAPELARALWPAYPVRTAISVRGDARGKGGRVEAHATARTADGGWLRFAGDVEPARMTTRDGVRVTARGLDLAKLVGGLGPDAHLALAIDATLRPGPLRPGGVTGSLLASVRRARVRGSTFGPLHLRADAVGGRASVSLRARMPGAHLTATAEGTTDEARGKATLAVPDVGGLRRALAALGLDGLPAVDGRARVEIRARGAPRAGPGSVALDVRARVPRLELSSGSGRRRWRGLAVSARLAPRQDGRRRFALKARAKAPVRGSLAASGDLRAAARSAELLNVTLRYPGARWRSTEPAVVSWGEVLQVSHLRLEHGAQRLALDLRVWHEGAAEHLDGTLRAQDLRTRWLAGLVPKLARVKGRVSGKVRLSGSLGQPVMRGTLRWRHGFMVVKPRRATRP